MIPLVTGAAVAFWVLAPVMVLAALGVIVSRKPIHSAMSLAVVMISLAVQYVAQDAPFLFVVQIIVYTGAILMLFLFVVMLVGVDTTESAVETIRHHRVPAVIAGIGFGLLLLLGIGNALTTPTIGLESANSVDGGNVPGLAYLIFSRYVLAFEAASALLITAALGAMVLAHRERLTPKRSQREFVAERMKRYADAGVHPGNLPNPGVFARHNGIATPALLPDGSISELSVSPTLRERGQVMDPDAMVKATKTVHSALSEGRDDPALAPGWGGPSRRPGSPGRNQDAQLAIEGELEAENDPTGLPNTEQPTRHTADEDEPGSTYSSEQLLTGEEDQ